MNPQSHAAESGKQSGLDGSYFGDDRAKSYFLDLPNTRRWSEVKSKKFNNSSLSRLCKTS